MHPTFTEALAATSAPARANRIDQIIAAAGPTDGPAIAAAVCDPNLSIAHVVDALKAYGVVVSLETVRRYRRAHA